MQGIDGHIFCLSVSLSLNTFIVNYLKLRFTNVNITTCIHISKFVLSSRYEYNWTSMKSKVSEFCVLYLKYGTLMSTTF